MKQTESFFNTIATRLINFCTKHSIVLFIAVFAVLSGYILVLTNQISGTVPTQESINAKLKAVPKPKIDSSVTKTILELEDRNINTQTIFDQARQNPFSE